MNAAIDEKTYLTAMKEEHPGVRVKWIVKEYYGSTNRKLAEALGMSPAAVGNVVNLKSKPSHDVYAGIMRLHPEISPDWLVLGEEPRLRTDDPCYKIKQENEQLRRAAEQFMKIIKK